MEQLIALKSQLESTRRVVITGPAGSPLLAQGNFANGEFDTKAVDEDGSCGILWSVGLTTVSDRNTADSTIPMHQLSHIEIRIGGILFATSEEIDGTKIALGIRHGNKFDTCRPDGSRRKDVMTRSAVCEFDSKAYFTFHLQNFPDADWRSLRSLNMHNRSIAIRNEEREELGLEYVDEDELNSEALDMYSYITERLTLQHVGQRCEITSISFRVGCVKDAIESLRRGDEFERLKEKYLNDNFVDQLHEVIETTR